MDIFPRCRIPYLPSLNFVGFLSFCLSFYFECFYYCSSWLLTSFSLFFFFILSLSFSLSLFFRFLSLSLFFSLSLSLSLSLSGFLAFLFSLFLFLSLSLFLFLSISLSHFLFLIEKYKIYISLFSWCRFIAFRMRNNLLRFCWDIPGPEAPLGSHCL